MTEVKRMYHCMAPNCLVDMRVMGPFGELVPGKLFCPACAKRQKKPRKPKLVWRWRAIQVVNAVPFYEMFGFKNGWERLVQSAKWNWNSGCRDWLRGYNPPRLHHGLRPIPKPFAECDLYDLWPSLRPHADWAMHVPSHFAFLAKVDSAWMQQKLINRLEDIKPSLWVRGLGPLTRIEVSFP